MKTHKLKQKINFQVSVNDTESKEITGTIIELMAGNKVKAEYMHPVHGYKMKKIVSL